MKARNYFAIDAGAYFADEKPKFVIVQNTENWKVYYSGDWLMSTEFGGDIDELEPNENGACQWSPIEIDIEKLKRYMARIAKPEGWRNFTKAFKEKHHTDGVLDGPHLAATWVVDGIRIMNVNYYGILDSEDLNPHFQKANQLMRYLKRNGKFNDTLNPMDLNKFSQ